MYRPEANLVAGRALAQAGAHAEAAAAFRAGSDWVRSHALPHVTVPLDSFLHRNPVNRELLRRRRAPACVGGVFKFAARRYSRARLQRIEIVTARP